MTVARLAPLDSCYRHGTRPDERKRPLQPTNTPDPTKRPKTTTNAGNASPHPPEHGQGRSWGGFFHPPQNPTRPCNSLPCQRPDRADTADTHYGLPTATGGTERRQKPISPPRREEPPRRADAFSPSPKNQQGTCNPKSTLVSYGKSWQDQQ